MTSLRLVLIIAMATVIVTLNHWMMSKTSQHVSAENKQRVKNRVKRHARTHTADDTHYGFRGTAREELKNEMKAKIRAKGKYAGDVDDAANQN